MSTRLRAIKLVLSVAGEAEGVVANTEHQPQELSAEAVQGLKDEVVAAAEAAAQRLKDGVVVAAEGEATSKDEHLATSDRKDEAIDALAT